ncbi:ArnT family glycosyltransferase [Chitinophaga nivalis]|uniref:Glycosyltransferase family 39 protein n=1 Tax=Chitinophaga nivalis TaxID=2991709 RepID=A0ABT3IUI4_9BACT|nr:glycosyltransferase family 39 protein [Chitinophaga nivalis]MCW3462705.1 glycosyltransferase family 39 protein [Chitinophaga nivalis]MCW3487604.1 glycosyltransferase family 39 protein [Chitinophaga nivalis]
MNRRVSLLLLLSFVVIKIVFQYGVIHPGYDLHRDEYLHLDMAHHLAAGYLSVPPLTAFNSLLIHWLGNGTAWVHFFPALYGALTLVLIWQMVALLRGGWYAQVLAATAFICSGMARINLLYQPNSFDVLAWTTVCWCLLQYLHTAHSKWLWWLGIATGIGILNKYNIGFLTVAWLAALLVSRPQTFRRPALYYAGIITLLIILPNLIWQVRMGWPVIHHMQELRETQLVHVSRMSFMADQLLFFIGGVFLFLAALAGWLFFPPFRPYRLLGWTYLFAILLFAALKAKSYYAAGLFPLLLVFGSVYWEQLFRPRLWRYVRPLWLGVIILPFAAAVPIIFPVQAPEVLITRQEKMHALGLLYWEDGKEHALPQDFADMLGWRQLAALTLTAWQQVPPADKATTLIICDNYGQAGALNYYNQGKMPAAVSFGADYVYWIPAMDTIRYIIKVGKAPEKRLMPLFGQVQQTGMLHATLSREEEDSTAVYLLSGLSPRLPAVLREGIYKKQQSYRGIDR